MLFGIGDGEGGRRGAFGAASAGTQIKRRGSERIRERLVKLSEQLSHNLHLSLEKLKQ
jgi:hypothetical protein